jgi:hypothetical protein
MTIREQIFGYKNIYSEFIYDEKNLDLQGWGSVDKVFEYLLPKIKPNLIIEIGSWKGRSAIHMAQLTKKYNSPAEILCIDTFLGSPQMWINKDNKNFYKSLKIKNGYPQVYNTFLNNIHFKKVEDLITPLPIDSYTAIKVLAFHKTFCNFFYIDGGHEYPTIKSDLNNIKVLMKDDATIILDDFGWRGVNKAAKEFSLKNNISLYFNKDEKGKAVLTSRKDLFLDSFFNTQL